MSEPLATLDDAPVGPWWRRALLSLGWVGALAAIVYVLHALGEGQLSTPPFTDFDALRKWMDARDAVEVAFAFLRVVALVLAWYLLIVTVLGLLARLSRVPSLVALTDLGTIPAVRKLLGAVAGIGLTASAATLLVGPSLADDRPAAVETQGEDAAAGAVVIERLPDGSTLVIERLPDDDGSATMRVVDAEGQAVPTTWFVQPGDHFWHIAEATLADAWGRAPTDAEIVPYWRQLVEVNRPRLVDQSNPDLIYPGQVFDLPAPPAAPASPPPPPGASVP